MNTELLDAAQSLFVHKIEQWNGNLYLAVTIQVRSVMKKWQECFIKILWQNLEYKHSIECVLDHKMWKGICIMYTL